jgi:hypothetical protein
MNCLIYRWTDECMHGATACRNASFRRNIINYLPNESHRFLLCTLSVCLFHLHVLSIIQCTALVIKSPSRLDSSCICFDADFNPSDVIELNPHNNNDLPIIEPRNSFFVFISLLILATELPPISLDYRLD